MSRNSLKSVCRLIQSIKEEIPIEKQFVEDLKRSIELNDKKESRKPSQTYKPSSMNCLRNMYYQRIGIEPESESNAVLIGICESGTDRHERVQEAISRMKENNIEPKKMQIIYPKQGKSANLLLIEGVKNGKSSLKIMPPLYIHNEDGSYKENIRKMFQE